MQRVPYLLIFLSREGTRGNADLHAFQASPTGASVAVFAGVLS